MKTKKKILVVDDDPNLRKTLADILTLKGYESAVAANGRRLSRRRNGECSAWR